MITHQSVIATCTHAGVVVFRQMISSDDQTRNHFLMILMISVIISLLSSSLATCVACGRSIRRIDHWSHASVRHSTCPSAV